jgi:sugar phosphate isomerase/epimerase
MKIQQSSNEGTRNISRREFLAKGGMAAAALSLPSSGLQAALSDLSACPIVVFSKIYQELKLDLEGAADLTAAAGLDGVDCPVRAGGEIEPDQVTEALPRYAKLLEQKKLKLHLITSGITRVNSPRAEEVLRTARKLGVPYYRLGFFEQDKGHSADQQVKEVRSALKDVAAMNQQLGIGALFQNHSGSFGANLSDLREVVSGFDPAQIGVAFDIGHAILVHGKDWVTHFEAIKSHLKVAYIKDARHGGSWVRFGEGDIGQSGYFKRLRALDYQAPFSLHIEFDWSNKGKSRNRESLLNALRESRTVLKRWLTES